MPSGMLFRYNPASLQIVRFTRVHSAISPILVARCGKRRDSYRSYVGGRVMGTASNMSHRAGAGQASGCAVPAE